MIEKPKEPKIKINSYTTDHLAARAHLIDQLEGHLSVLRSHERLIRFTHEDIKNSKQQSKKAGSFPKELKLLNLDVSHYGDLLGKLLGVYSKHEVETISSSKALSLIEEKLKEINTKLTGKKRYVPFMTERQANVDAASRKAILTSLALIKSYRQGTLRAPVYEALSLDEAEKRGYLRSSPNKK